MEKSDLEICKITTLWPLNLLFQEATEEQFGNVQEQEEANFFAFLHIFKLIEK